jgi:hypothetical protein
MVHFHKSNPPTILTTIYWEHHLFDVVFSTFSTIFFFQESSPMEELMEVVNVASASKE